MPETARRMDHDHSLLATLDQVARVVEAAGAGSIDPEERTRAENLALALARSGDGSLAGTAAPVVAFVASLLSELTLCEVALASQFLDMLSQCHSAPLSPVHKYTTVLT